jgi:hypothetical protein
MNTFTYSAISLQDFDYQEVDNLLQEQASNLSPEVKTIIAKAVHLARRRTQNHTWRTYEDNGEYTLKC